MTSMLLLLLLLAALLLSGSASSPVLAAPQSVREELRALSHTQGRSRREGEQPPLVSSGGEEATWSAFAARGYSQVRARLSPLSRLWKGPWGYKLRPGFAPPLRHRSVESMAECGKLTLQSKDGEMFEVDREVASKSETLRDMIEGVEPSAADHHIQLPFVSGKILAKVVEYCKYHADVEKGSTPTEEEREAWEAEFVRVDEATLMELIVASNQLNINGLTDLTAKTIAAMVVKMTWEENRAFMDNIVKPALLQNVTNVGGSCMRRH